MCVNPALGSQPWEMMATSFRVQWNLVCYTAVFRVVTQRSSPLWGGALCDDTKNGCVAD